ncbi:MAG: HAMP domain-containing sensor histidine kinase [Acidimicrobiales bacterium]
MAVVGGRRQVDATPCGDDPVVARGSDDAVGANAAIVLDACGRVANVTSAACSILGVRSADLVGTTIGQLAAPEDRLRLARWLSEVQASAARRDRADVSTIAFRVARRHDRQAEARARSVGGQAESDPARVLVELWVGAGAPLDDRSQVVELQERVNRLEQTNHQLKTFACTAAHELKAPLASLAASVEELVWQSGPDLDETGQELVGSLLRRIRQMGELVDSVIQSSLVGRRLQIELADGDALVGDVVLELQHELDCSEAVVEVSALGPILADVEQLRSVFRNLLANAIRYRSPARPLQVRVDVHDGSLERRFTVSDNGRGIHSADRERAFAMFERLDSRMPGSGIGLATCRRIIEGHGGRVWLDDGIDGGLAVHFTLPAQHLLGS